MSELEWLEIFADNLVDRMNEAGITQKELAKESGLEQSTISRYITKQRMPTIKAVINLGYVLDCDFNDFIDFGDIIE